ncbi:MAG: FkbM family methyltransferase [Oscillospiraceae bacterium]|nr:FkbM family methyltransferase [Oscillospiraceae bacterium]
MLQEDEIKRIYTALADETSRNIFRHRLLYSLYGDRKEITKIVYEYSPAQELLSNSKICYYGAGVGSGWLVRYNTNVTFVIDKYKTGEIEGWPVISLDDFLKLPDCKEYVIIITVGKENVLKEITAELAKHDLRYVLAYSDLQYSQLQYFDLPELKLQNEFFVDAGALDGNTTRYLLDHFKKNHAYVFEPNPQQFSITEKNLKTYPNTELFPYGLYDRDTALCFDVRSYDASSARISENGSIQIEVRRLDNLLRDKKVTFIKMDIEGSELAALRGGEKIIREQRPKLAVSVYHKPEDIWEIPRLLLDCHPDYQLYLRHYSISYTETVLYAV